MSNVVPIGCITTLDVPVEKVIAGAADLDLDSVIVVGLKEGKLYFAHSDADAGTTCLLLEKAKSLLVAEVDTL